ncbi:hypothetical protein BD309DRAFT_951835 [Dichomitus squalens]|nr:hypothetical protein BD309DRAFT_951835 [Dichomitus squalens]
MNWGHQATILRANNARPTMGQLAIVIAREVNRFLEHERMIGNPLKYLSDRELSLADIVLIEIHHVTRGSLQPILGVLRH